MSEPEINKYQNGKIYKIWNDTNDEIYVGSTHDTLSRRMTKHRASAKVAISRRIYQTMNELGIEHFRIELVENFPCKSKEELNAREGYWIRLIGTLNSVIAGRTKKEYKTDNAEKIKYQSKEYYEKNKEKIDEACKEYYNEHKTIILEYHQQHYEQNKEIVQERLKKYRESHTEEKSLQNKAYYQENKAKINEYKKNWYQQNKEAVIARVKANSERKQRYEEKKEALSVKVDCSCGGCFTVMSKSKHLKTKLHKKYEESKE
jgi:hypothetical protein